jgi:hypothetical protein
VPFALGGSTAAFAVAIVVSAGVIALFVRRYKDRGKGDKPPPWAV